MMSRLQFQKKIACVMTHPFWLHVNDLVVLEINVKIFMEYHLLLKWLLQMLNVKSYGLPDCAWSNVWIHCEPWQITYIVKNPYFFMQPELETYPFSYVLHETTTTMDSNSIHVFLCCCSVTAEKFKLLMSYMHFNNRKLSIIIHLITTPLHVCMVCGISEEFHDPWQHINYFIAVLPKNKMPKKTLVPSPFP